MKLSTGIAIVLYCIGLSKIIDWFIFWNKNEYLAKSDYKAFKQLYIEHFPGYLKHLHDSNPEPATILVTVLFIVSGLLFFKEKGLLYKILAISSFAFATWHLFSLM